jgi:hypothetical protein
MVKPFESSHMNFEITKKVVKPMTTLFNLIIVFLETQSPD